MSFYRHCSALLLGSALLDICNGHEEGAGPGCEPTPQDEPAPERFAFIRGDEWTTGSDISLGGVFFPNVHFNAVLGTSSGVPEALAAGHHDPNREGITLQNVEVGMGVRAGEHVEGSFTYAAVLDQQDHWQGSVEEAFVRVRDLPGGFELRGGRYYNRFGFYNTLHPHAYPFVNRDLLEARMLGEDAVTTEGGEVIWNFPGNTHWSGAISLSYGRVYLEEKEEEEDSESLFSADGAYFSDRLFSADARVNYRRSDSHEWTGLASFMTGDNGYGQTTEAAAAGLEYKWRASGSHEGGRSFRWRTQVMHRQVGAASMAEAGNPVRRRSLHETGISTAALYGFNEKFHAGIGIAFVEGMSAAGLNGRWRLSPMVQWNFSKKMNLRLQYDHDIIRGVDSEDSIWLQANISWGSN
jgi:hypothetical protein